MIKHNGKTFSGNTNYKFIWQNNMGFLKKYWVWILVLVIILIIGYKGVILSQQCSYVQLTGAKNKNNYVYRADCSYNFEYGR